MSIVRLPASTLVLLKLVLLKLLSSLPTGILTLMRNPVQRQLKLFYKLHWQGALAEQDLVAGELEDMAGIHGFL